MKRKLTPRRGATIERAAVLRKIRALKKKWLTSTSEDYSTTELLQELLDFVSGRVDRFTKRKGGL